MQPTHAGWYWDPAGRPGLFRWWDGVAWTRHVSPDRTDPSPEPFRAMTPGDDGLLHTDVLAFPELEDPWRQCPAYSGFASAVGQERIVGRTPRGEYDALVVIGSTPERFAALAPADVATTLCDEVLRTFYPHAEPVDPAQAREVEVDGRPAVRLDVEMGVHDPTLDFSTEQVLLVVVPADGPAGLLYASLPAVEGVPTPDNVLAMLRVSPSTSAQ
ncbi:MAG TPA: DUF2510 domain-containing protein [Aeromicrobium sp.]|nr:DUF2510 domain-containing protein [Aeromicrobium sp.]